MEEYDLGGAEAGFHRQNAAIQRLSQKLTRLYRMAQFMAVALLLLLLGALALLTTVGLGGRCHVSPDGKAKMLPDSHSSDDNIQQGTARIQANTDIKHPSAMLTVPLGNSTDGVYLQWESAISNAYCQGGFSYSNGDLVVPRDGIYRVFLQITYEGYGKHCPFSEMKLNNKVLFYRKSYHDDVTLLTSDDTMTCSEEPWTKSLYTSGLFKLEANGRLHVKSNYRQFIARNEHQVFFGAELLPQ